MHTKGKCDFCGKEGDWEVAIYDNPEEAKDRPAEWSAIFTTEDFSELPKVPGWLSPEYCEQHGIETRLACPTCHRRKRIAVFVLESIKSPWGDYAPCVVTEGETGYHKTDWEWSADFELAQQMADEYNEKLGLTKEEVFHLVLQSMKEK